MQSVRKASNRRQTFCSIFIYIYCTEKRHNNRSLLKSYNTCVFSVHQWVMYDIFILFNTILVNIADAKRTVCSVRVHLRPGGSEDFNAPQVKDCCDAKGLCRQTPEKRFRIIFRTVIVYWNIRLYHYIILLSSLFNSIIRTYIYNMSDEFFPSSLYTYNWAQECTKIMHLSIYSSILCCWTVCIVDDCIYFIHCTREKGKKH